MKKLILTLMLVMPTVLFAQSPPPPIEPGVSLELAKWRAARYSDVRYKLNLTLEKMSPVLKGTMEVRVKVGARTLLSASSQSGEIPPIILDWRKIRGHEDKSTISNVSLNGKPLLSPQTAIADKSVRAPLEEISEHLIFREGVVAGENVIKLDFTSPILTSGSAITRYVDKEDGSEYIYSLFVPSDASTAFPVFDQPDLKARFTLEVVGPADWRSVANERAECESYHSVTTETVKTEQKSVRSDMSPEIKLALTSPEFAAALKECAINTADLTHSFALFPETKPISTYVFAFAAGPWEKVSTRKPEPGAIATGFSVSGPKSPVATAPGSDIYVRRSQAAKFKPHASEVFRLNREAVNYFEQYFDYKFPFPKYDLVLIPEFPFGGMEHAGATFLRESSIIFPQEPTKNDLVSRATLIFHEAAHQWFGDTVTMRWFDDLWLKEGFATFTAYKAMEKIMPEMNAWKVFYERIKQGAYQTDSTRGTTAIYQPIANLSAAKSAYGNIVYNKAPAFLRQAEFYLGEDKFQTAVRAFLKKHEFGNAGWEDLVNEFRNASWDGNVTNAISESMEPYWTENWINKRGVPVYRIRSSTTNPSVEPISAFSPAIEILQSSSVPGSGFWDQKTKVLQVSGGTGHRESSTSELKTVRPFVKNASSIVSARVYRSSTTDFLFPNYGDYGYGIFLLDEKSRDYVLKNIQNEKDSFLRTMMWGALWDSVREGELDPRVFVELVVKNLNVETDESTIATLLGRTGTALNYYLSEPGTVVTGFRQVRGTKNPVATAPGSDKNPPAHAGGSDLRGRVEHLLIERMQNAPSLGQRITYYRAFLNIAASKEGQGVLRAILTLNKSGFDNSTGFVGMMSKEDAERIATFEAAIRTLPIKTKDKFDIITRLLILNDPDAPKLLADLEKAETSDEAKRYAYAARAGIPTAENKAKYWKDFTENKEISESWIEAAFGPWNSVRHSELTLPYLERALKELPNHKRNRKIFFVNGWLGAFIGGQRSPEALAVVNKFLADNPPLDNDLRLKILENVDLIERAVNIRRKFPQV